jgi:uncharacterized membrane protein YbhN (UPF0104 family)
VGYARVISHIRVYLVGWFAGLGVPEGAASLGRLAIIAADKRSVPRGLVASLLERTIQATVAVALLVVSSVYLSSLTFDTLKWLLLACGILAVVALAFIFASRVRLSRRPGRWLSSRRRLRVFVEELRSAVREVRHMEPGKLAAITAVALLSALLTVTALYLASRALDIHIRYMVLMTAWAAVGLTGLLPISINGLGPREGILTAAVAGAGLNSEGGVALGLLWFFMQAVTRMAAGLAWLTVLRSPREGENAGPREGKEVPAGLPMGQP